MTGSSPLPSHRVLWLALSLLVMFSLRLSQPLMERQQELRVALAARSVVESGNWMVPEFQQNLRVRKPPLMTWLEAGVFTLTGKTDSAALARSVSVAAALLLLGLLYRWVREAADDELAWWTVAGLGISFLFIRHARSAETDMLLGLWIVLALRHIYLLARGQGGVVNWLVAGAAMGLGFMTKGPAAVAIPVILLIAHWRRLPAKGKTLGFISALFVAALIASPWYIYISQFLSESPEAQEALRKEVMALVQTAHPGSLVYYVYTLPWVMMPTGLLLPWAIKRMFSKDLAPMPRFARIWFLSGFILLTLTPSKQAHYALLLVVPAAILCGPVLADLGGQKRWLAKAALILPALALHAYLQWGSPVFNPYHRVPEFIEPYTKAMHQAKHVHVVGINSAIIEFYGGLHVHAAEAPHGNQHVDFAIRRAYEGDVILAIGKEEKLNGGAPLPSGWKQREQAGDTVYAVYYREPPISNAR